MKCYMCAQEGKETDAVAICIVCGMALCKDHVVHEELEMWEGGYPLPPKKAAQKLPRILCPPCHKALV